MKSKYKKNKFVETINLLNNQNYILWKTEKRKLLSKFFIEKYIKFYVYYWVSLFYSIIVSFLKIIIVTFIMGFIFYNIYGIFMILTFSLSWILRVWFIFVLFYFLYEIFKLFIWWYFKPNIKNINNLKDFFSPPYMLKYNKKDTNIGFNLESFFYIFVIFILTTSILYIPWIFISFPILVGTVAFIFILLFLKFNLFSLIIFIFFVLSIPFTFLYSFFIKSRKKYLFTKSKPNIKILKPFIKLKKNKAENKYYRIIEK